MVEAKVVYSHENMKSRGFGFVVFRGEEAVDAVLQDYYNHYLHGRWIECKPAMLKDELVKQPSEEPAPANPKHPKPTAGGSAANCKKNRGPKSNSKQQPNHPDSLPTKILTQQQPSKRSRLPKDSGASSLKLAVPGGEVSSQSDALRSSGSKQLQSANTSSQLKIDDSHQPSNSKAKKSAAASGKRKAASNKNKPPKRPANSAASEDYPFGQHSSSCGLQQLTLASRTRRPEADPGFRLASQPFYEEQTELGLEPFAQDPREPMNMHPPLHRKQVVLAGHVPSLYYPPPCYSYQAPQRFPPLRPQHAPYEQIRHPSSIQPRARFAEARLFGQPEHGFESAPVRSAGRFGRTPEPELDDQLFDFDGRAVLETRDPLEFHHPDPEAAPDMSGLSRYGESSQRIRGFDSLHPSAYFDRNHLPIGFAAPGLQGADALHWYGRPWETGTSAFYQSSDIDAFEPLDAYADPQDHWLGDATQDCQNQPQRGVCFQVAPDSTGFSPFTNAQSHLQSSPEARGAQSQEQWGGERSGHQVSAVNPDERHFERKARLFNSRTRDESELMMPEKSREGPKAAGSKTEIM